MTAAYRHRTVGHRGRVRGLVSSSSAGQLVRAVLERIAVGPRALAPLEGRDAAGVIDGFLDGWKRTLEASDYTSGCSVLGITVTAEDADLRAAAGDVFGAWATELARMLHEGGVAEPSARPLAWTLISGAEGAVAVCRARRSMEPLEAVRTQLKALIVQ